MISKKDIQKTCLISIRDLTKVYRTSAGEFPALKGINLDVFAGEFLVIVGKSGAGKTTLINAISGIDHFSSGRILFGKQEIGSMSEDALASWRGKNLGMIYQSFYLMPGLNLINNIALPLDFAGGFQREYAGEKAMELLRMVELEEHAFKFPSQISGGQQQRVAIARALINDSPVIVADRKFAGEGRKLDPYPGHPVGIARITHQDIDEDEGVVELAVVVNIEVEGALFGDGSEKPGIVRVVDGEDVCRPLLAIHPKGPRHGTGCKDIGVVSLAPEGAHIGSRQFTQGRISFARAKPACKGGIMGQYNGRFDPAAKAGLDVQRPGGDQVYQIKLFDFAADCAARDAVADGAGQYRAGKNHQEGEDGKLDPNRPPQFHAPLPV